MSLLNNQSFILFTRTVDGVALILIGAGVIIGWGLVLWRHGRDVIKENPRLGYCVGDVTLLAPGCIVAGIGLLAEAPWAPPFLLVAVGAATFDLTHTFIYCAEISWPRLPAVGVPPTWWYSVAILLVLVALEWLAWSDIRVITGSHIPPGILWASVPLAIIMAVGTALATAAIRKRSRGVSSAHPVP
ncbi:MAG TPA: hypothetical protein VHX62_10645 [Solirubrobacteraceae bacterium]|jgi:hypothetical protein|nr:hypothetical protein [Solirubrobacteraceae bacterium]